MNIVNRTSIDRELKAFIPNKQIPVKELAFANQGNESFIYQKYPDLWKQAVQDKELLDNNLFNLQEKNFPEYRMISNEICKNGSYANETLKGIQENSILSKTFFSKQNMKIIQNKLKWLIYEESGRKFVIGEQDENELLIIMRSIYLENSKNLPVSIKEQIGFLNEKVYEDIFPKLYSNVKQYIQYLADVSNPYQIMSRPEYVSQSGTKSYDLSRFI